MIASLPLKTSQDFSFTVKVRTKSQTTKFQACTMDKQPPNSLFILYFVHLLSLFDFQPSCFSPQIPVKYKLNVFTACTVMTEY